MRIVRDGPAGCVTVTTWLGPRYVPQDAALRPCTLPWDWLNQQAAGEAGVPDLDIKTKIESYLPMSVWPLVENTPDSACGDAFVGSVPAGRRRQIVREASQPFPFAGTIAVSWY